MKIHTYLLAVLAFVPVLRPRISGPSVAPQDEGIHTVILKRADLVLDHYHPQHVSAGGLHDLAGELAARWFLISDSGSVESVQSLRVVGKSLLLYDTREEVDRLKRFLASVDIAAPETKVVDEPPTVTAEYMPRFLSMETVQMLVERHVMVNVIEERGVALFEGYPDDIAAAKAVLKTFDIAPAQVFLTCQLIEVDGDTQGPPLPKELSDNLQKLLPGSTLNQVGMAMLRTTVGQRRTLAMQIQTEETTYEFSFTPLSFDTEAKALTIEECSLNDLNLEAQLFSTSVVLRANEYTVLAATGARTKLLVARVMPQ